MKQIASNVYVSTEYPEGNVGFFVLPTGAVVVDVPTLPMDALAWKEQIAKLAAGPILYVVLTDAHPDRLLNAGSLGAPIVAAQGAYERAAVYTDGFWRSAVDSWSRRYPKAADDLAQVRVALPEITFGERITLHKGGRDVVVERVNGGAPGSAWVHLKDKDVLFTGDTVVVGEHPFMEDVPDSKAWLNTLKSLRRRRYADTTIIPGRGPVSDASATESLSEYIALARRRARSLYASERARPDRQAVVAELLSSLPIGEDRRDSTQRRVKAGLDRLLDELQVAEEDE